MNRRSPLFVALFLALALVPFSIAAAVAPQDPQIDDDFRQEVVWNFAVLQYVNTRGETVQIPASRLTKVWLLRTVEDRMRLELLYENKDYSQITVDEFHVLRSAPNTSAVDVPVVRAEIDAMAFPAFR